MISYQIIEHGKPLQKVMQETPKPTGTEVLVKITRAGVCHSDVHIWDGYFDWGGGKRFYVKDRGCIPPFTLGHEPFGVVAAAGPRAKGVKVGQKRIVYPWIGCGKCAVCKAGQDNYCMKAQFLGVMKPGAYSSHVLVPHPKYLVDAAGIDEGFAATLGCSAITAYSGLNKLPKLGPTLSPLSAWLLLQGLESLPMRMDRHCANALGVAKFLQDHPRVAWVNYPGLPGNKYFSLAQKYLPKGASGLLNFGVKGGAKAGERFIEAAEFMSHLANIGDAKTLIIHPASTTHRQMSDEEQLKAGVTPDMIRMSVGIESLDDILWDIDQALSASAKA